MPSIHDFLTSEEWDEINSKLPDIELVVNRNSNFPMAEWLETDVFKDRDFEQLKCLRLARVCLHDAVDDIQGASFALGRAIGVRKFYLERRDATISEQESLGFADFYGRFYADDVSLRLYSAAKDALDAVYYLYNLKLENDAGSALKVLRKYHRQQLSIAFAAALDRFESSDARDRVWKYRNRWVHNQAPRIETKLYNPPREAGIDHVGMISFAGLGMWVPPEYQWPEWIAILSQALSDILLLYDACADEWQMRYNEFGI